MSWRHISLCASVRYTLEEGTLLLSCYFSKHSPLQLLRHVQYLRITFSIQQSSRQNDFQLVIIFALGLQKQIITVGEEFPSYGHNQCKFFSYEIILHLKLDSGNSGKSSSSSSSSSKSPSSSSSSTSS